jgi:hypothetical protein
MKHQMLSILTSLSVAFAPVTSFAGKGEGSRWPKKSACNKEMLDELWKSDKEDLKDEVRAYYKAKERPMEEEKFCEDIASRFDTEATTTCENGNCPRGKAKKRIVQQQDGQDIEQVARRYRDDPPPPPRPAPAPAPAPVGGGFGDMFNGNPMGYMLAALGGGFLGFMAGRNSGQQQPMFRSPYGPYMPGMMGGPGMMGPGGMRPPPFMPINRGGMGMGGLGGYGGLGGPAFGGMGGYGGSYAPGVVSPFNGANIYNGGYATNYGAGAYYGGAGAYSQNYFSGPPAVINASTGMRMFSVGGAAPAPTYNLLGR